MTRKLVATFVASMFLVAGQAFGGDARVKKALKKLEGTWKFVSVKKAGKDLPKEVTIVTVKIKGNKMSVVFPDGKVMKIKFKISPQSPASRQISGCSSRNARNSGKTSRSPAWARASSSSSSAL